MRSIKRFVAVTMIFAMVAGSQLGTTAVAAATQAASEEQSYVLYTVQKGDTLKKIAKAQLGDSKRVDEILELNRDVIKSADNIKVGMKLKLPVVTTASAAVGSKISGTAAAKIGDVVNGFKVVDITSFDLIKADVIVFEHVKTGALVMYLANEDTNRMFDITFRTPAIDDSGIPHVFEHSTLDGSEKYPSKSLFFNLSYQTYNTYMNAATYNFMTTFPIASLSEAQLLKFADYYTDSCFNPLVTTDSTIFDEEAWRYVLADPDDELTIAGTVYSEMTGAYTISSAAHMNFMKTLYPGSTVGNASGGIPRCIPEMTWRDVATYHKVYYHPSNSLTTIYGKFENFDAFLALLDSYFSEYEKDDVIIPDYAYAPLREDDENTFDFGLASGADTTRGSYVYYGFALDPEEKNDVNAYDFLAVLLADTSSILSVNLKKALPHAATGISIDFSAPGTAFLFSAAGIEPEEAEIFKKTVDSSLAEIAAKGFDKNAVDAIVSAFKMDLLMTPESSTIGEDILPMIAYYWAGMGDIYGFMDYVDAIDDFADMASDGTLVNIISKELLAPETISAVVVTRPVAGLKDIESRKLADKLAEYKASLSESEIAALVEATARYNEEDTTDNTEYLKQLTAVTVDSLPEEARIYDYTDRTDESGICRVNVDANVDGIGQETILLDAAGLTIDQVPYFQLYVDLIGSMDTGKHSVAELSSAITRYLYSPVVKVSLMDSDDEHGFHPYMRATFTTLDEDMENAYDLMYEILFDTDFTDLDVLMGEISSLRIATRESIDSASYAAQLYRARGAFDESMAYYNLYTYFNYYEFLTAIEQQLAEDPTAVINSLKAIASYFKNSTNAVSAYVGNNDNVAHHEAVSAKFFDRLEKKPVVAQTYEYEPIAESEAFITDASVQYNLIFAGLESIGLDEIDAGSEVITSYVSDAFLYPMIRDRYGAYSVLHGIDDIGMYIVTYRDPNVIETFEVFAQLPELIKSLENVPQEVLDGYIMSTYSYYAQSAGELTGGYNAMLCILSGEDQSEILESLHAIKSVTPESAKKYIEIYRKFIDEGIISTSGSAAAINKNAPLFESIYNLFGAADLTEIELTDVPEASPFYHAVRFVFENGFMEAASEDKFGIDMAATLGEYAVGIYMMLGGNNNQADAIEYLTYFGLVPAGQPGDTMTRADLTTCVAALCYTLQVPYPEVLAANYPAQGITDGDSLATRGDLAFVLTAVGE